MKLKLCLPYAPSLCSQYLSCDLLNNSGCFSLLSLKYVFSVTQRSWKAVRSNKQKQDLNSFFVDSPCFHIPTGVINLWNHESSIGHFINLHFFPNLLYTATVQSLQINQKTFFNNVYTYIWSYFQIKPYILSDASKDHQKVMIIKTWFSNFPNVHYVVSTSSVKWMLSFRHHKTGKILHIQESSGGMMG